MWNPATAVNQTVKLALGALGTLASLAVSGCFLMSAPTEERITVTSVEPPRPTVFVSAVPSYRLIIEPRAADLPSRLLLLYTRIETASDDALGFDPTQAKLVLPDGTRARVFDRTRATVLLDRTELGSWDLSYAHEPRSRAPRGGFVPVVQQRLKKQVRETLLDQAIVRRGQPLTGFLLVDTGVALTSLDRVSLEVVTSRAGDAQPYREVYQFAATSTVQSQR